MNIKNHCKMGCLIYESMATNGIRISKPLFVAGNMAPDFYISPFSRSHKRSTSASRLNKWVKRVYENIDSTSTGWFSFNLGILAHYICDFLCYPHTPAFEGGKWDHYIYEKMQVVDLNDVLPITKGAELNAEELIDVLNGYFIKREQILEQNADMAFADISVAMYVAILALTCVYHYVSKRARDVTMCFCSPDYHDMPLLYPIWVSVRDAGSLTVND